MCSFLRLCGVRKKSDIQSDAGTQSEGSRDGVGSCIIARATQ